jgi:hypothetical protein
MMNFSSVTSLHPAYVASAQRQFLTYADDPADAGQQKKPKFGLMIQLNNRTEGFGGWCHAN